MNCLENQIIENRLSQESLNWSQQSVMSNVNWFSQKFTHENRKSINPKPSNSKIDYMNIDSSQI